MDSHFYFLQKLKDSGHGFDVIYDIGSNIGAWSYEASQIYPDAKYEMFEPLIGRNKDTDDKASSFRIHTSSLHPIALSDFNGYADLKILDSLGVGSSILILDSDRMTDTNIISCETHRLDDYVKTRCLPQPDFIKLDTQGSELKILKAAEKTIDNAKFILTETWSRRIYGPETPLFHELSAWLYNHGFLLYDFFSLDDGRDNCGELKWFDALFINRRFSKIPHWAL